MTYRHPRAFGACAALLLVSIAAPALAGTITTNASNSTPIVIPDFGAASPYGSEIPVLGLRGEISAVSVTLNGVSHTYPDDLEVLLVSPAGQMIQLMSDAGGSGDINNDTLTFAAGAAAMVDSGQLVSGTYGPSEYGGLDPMPAPAPSGPYSTDLGSLNGAAIPQNGTWRLFVADDAHRDQGIVAGGWTLSITSSGFTSCEAEGYGGSQKALCHQICEVDHPEQRLNGLINAWMRQYGTEPPCAN